MASRTEIDIMYEGMRQYERRMSRLLIAFISSGLVFLLGPGSFLGLWNLFAISHQQTLQAVGPAWLQAHGHAEVYGWVGSFILGIGLHSLTRQTSVRVNFAAAWSCWSLWTLGVAMRWCTGVTDQHWRLLLPLSAALELAAFGIFQYLVSRAHRPTPPRGPAQPREKFPGWIFLVLTGALGFGLTLLVNFAGVLAALAAHAGPVLPPAWDGRLVELMAWAFLAPFVFGFSTRWLPVFAGLRPAVAWVPRALAAILAAGALVTLLGWWLPAALVWALAAALAAWGLRIFMPAVAAAKTQGVHWTFPWFLRIAYFWLLVSAAIGIVAVLLPASGLSGSGRHAFTVGFIATTVLTIGQRILPAFSGMRKLYSPALMFVCLATLEIGCLLRVSGEMLAYPGWFPFAWRWLPLSATLEVAAFAVFAYNLIRTLLSPPAHTLAKR
ncbi:MAG TPA: NnrS family protein [Terriglobales bacterium]|nr:NnrS family protein [Terriglobales bacterium]